MNRILYIARKEVIQIFRDPRMFGIIFIAPVFQLFLFGYAVTTDVKNIAMAVMDRDNSSRSRELKDALFNSGYFENAGSADSERDIEAALVHSRADMVMVIPDGFGGDLASGAGADIQVLLDGAESNSATVGMGYLGKTVQSFTEAELDNKISALKARTDGKVKSVPAIIAQTRFSYNPRLESSVYFVPGVLATILMIITMLLTSLAITREREIGTIEALVVTPIKPYQLILGKMLPFAVIGFLDISLILVVALGHFHVPFRGAPPLLYFCSGIFLFSTLGMGLLISTVSNTQQQAIFVTMLVLQPAILLSGLMFPIANMPESVQYLTYLNPLRYFLVILRGVMLKGNDFQILAPQIYALLALGIGLFSLAVARFHKTID